MTDGIAKVGGTLIRGANGPGVVYVRADLYDAAWNEAIEAALVLVRENSMSSLAAEKAIRALRREPSK